MKVLSKFDPALEAVYGGADTSTTTSTTTNTCNGATTTVIVKVGPIEISGSKCTPTPSTPSGGGSSGGSSGGSTGGSGSGSGGTGGTTPTEDGEEKRQRT